MCTPGFTVPLSHPHSNSACSTYSCRVHAHKPTPKIKMILARRWTRGGSARRLLADSARAGSPRRGTGPCSFCSSAADPDGPGRDTTPSVRVRIADAVGRGSVEEREACLSNLRVNIEPRWFEDYELVHVSDGLAVDITGAGGKEDTRSLQIEVKALSGGSRDDGDGPREEEVITLACPSGATSILWEKQDTSTTFALAAGRVASKAVSKSSCRMETSRYKRLGENV